jgi:mono/diheme cytochrome c family protein
MKSQNQRSLTLLFLACAAALAIAGCKAAPGKPGPDSETPRPEQVADFSTLYSENCASCHGVNGKFGAAISLANPEYMAIAAETDIERVTASGVPGTTMPPFGKAAGGMLTDKQIAIIAKGMKQNWGIPDALPVPPYASSGPGDPMQGQKTFATFCARCHGADGSGAIAANGVVAGSLVDPAYLALISDQGLRSLIIVGQPEQGMPDWRSHMNGPGARAMTNQEITDTVAWLASHRIATPGQPYKQHP